MENQTEQLKNLLQNSYVTQNNLKILLKQCLERIFFDNKQIVNEIFDRRFEYSDRIGCFLLDLDDLEDQVLTELKYQDEDDEQEDDE